MIVAFGFLDRALDMLGLVYVTTIVWKAARGYPIGRWLF